MKRMATCMFSICALLIAITNVTAQQKPVMAAKIPAEALQTDPDLFFMGGMPVKLSEFKYVYNKNNNNAPDAYSQKSLDDYLNLYINFRLKVKEAVDMGMDTVESINKELNTYRQQLAKSYLYDREVNEQLMSEAYQRSKNEVRASHILISIDESGLPSDTLEAYKKAVDLRKRLLKGEDFATLARQNSADPSAKTNGGDIGYFTVFQTVYPFENAVYSMKPGEISMPVRTKFGYHVVKVTDVRPAMGKMKAAHILLKLPLNATPEQEKAVQDKAELAYKDAIGGQTAFEVLAEKYSEDRQTYKKGGVLPEFGIGKMVQEFESAAFALQKDGDISKPVKTEYGYHIIKRIHRDSVPSFEESKGELKKKVERDTRSSVAKHKMVDKIKAEYNFVENKKSKDDLYKLIADKLAEGKFEMKDKSLLTGTLFTLAGKNYTQNDFVTFLEDRQKKKRAEPALKIYNDFYNLFVDETCLAYEESQLERKYPDFKNLMKEYHDGILLFELTDKKVWSKAVTDTVGLKDFYETVKNKYMWGERANVEIFTIANDPKTVKAARKLILKDEMTPGEIAAKYNVEGKENVKFEIAKYEKGQNELVDKLTWTKGVSDNFLNADSTTTIVKIKAIDQPTPKSLNETKGFIISDYQEYLEKAWIEELKKKYPVKVMPGVLNSLIKK
jgi:peptidyl-prolyl cis-trans isomerase SurA